MTLFLRNKNKQSIVDIDIWVKTDENHKFIEINSSVIIDTYSDFLMNHLDNATEIIDTFTYISDLRGWLWESYFAGTKNDPEKLQDVINEVRTFLKDVAKKYDLYYVED